MAKKHKYDYFDAYEELSDLAVQEASVLLRAMENFTDAAALREVLDEAHEIEHAGDMINHDIYKHVGGDFMPPFDREDIVALAGALDEILDEIEDVLQYFYMFDIHQIPEDALRFAFEALSEQQEYALCAGAELDIVMVRPRSRCLECGAEYDHDRFHMLCPECGSFATELVAGRELQIDSIEVDIPDDEEEGAAAAESVSADA